MSLKTTSRAAGELNLPGLPEAAAHLRRRTTRTQILTQALARDRLYAFLAFLAIILLAFLKA